ncbi:MAG: DNA replication and repair protein RecF [candidate division WS2 bacterium]|nr:DNA replication and repair protein RecF [Candidatus Psychracetigena formicireducens]
MLKELEIKNFKSIKHLRAECKRINIFIGEPNTGKSNILETFGLLSFGRFYEPIKNYVRFESLTNLFYDDNLEESVFIKVDDVTLEIKYEKGRYRGSCIEKDKVSFKVLYSFDFDYTGGGNTSNNWNPPYKYYKFTIRNTFPKKEAEFLLPPFGDNLLAVVRTHKEINNIISEILEPFGLKLVFRSHEDKIEILKLSEKIFISYPYSLLSETLQGIIFFLTAIYSNKESVISFEEPEAHSFPYYTKYLAEQIALDTNNNQYFISTHNPYLLLSILEKSPKDEIAVFITHFIDHQTKVKSLGKKELGKIMDLGIDIFFNIERFLGTLK